MCELGHVRIAKLNLEGFVRKLWNRVESDIECKMKSKLS